MNIHEYQAKELLRSFNVPVLRGKAVFTAEEAGKVAHDEFEAKGSKVIVVKSQIHAGGRGKGVVHDTTSGKAVKLFNKELRGVNV
ncbi:MAG: ATP-grasp domain-containing protein, partial [Candidatus Kapaibacterium sp.]